MRTKVSLFLVVIIPQLVSSQLFVNSALDLGIEHTFNSVVHYGAGVSFFDFDNDGWDDITLFRNNDSARFYKNMGGYFELLPSAVYVPERAAQIIWVDYDNDGDYDFFLSTYNSGQCRLFQNDGNFGFTDVTLSAGLIGLNTANYGVSFGDYDKDGDLDFYLCRYYKEGDTLNPLITNALYRNNGDGTFTNVTTLAGVGNGARPSFMGIWLDYNNDSYPDLYVINDRGLWINTMYRNNGDGTFTDVTQATNTAMQYGLAADDPMSATFADFDNDGDNDIFASNSGVSTTPARLLVANNGVFSEQAAIRNVNLYEWAWGSTFIDVDNDTWQDLYVTTGKIANTSSSEVRSYLFMSNAGVNFTDAPQNFSNPSEHIAASYGVAKGDVNNDGFADLMVLNAKGFNSFLWVNSGTSTNNYIKVTLEGTISNRMATGSWIRVYAGGNTYSFYTRCGENYCGQNSQHHIFGMGQHESIDSITVTYLSGITDVYYDLDVDEHYYFTEGETLLFAIDSPQQVTICEGNQYVLSAPAFSTYQWNTGDTTQTISAASSGLYYLSAENQYGHIYYSDTIEVLVMDAVYAAHVAFDLDCFESQNGAISLSVFNQTQNFEVNWSNGETGLELIGLSAGTYSYVYTDEFGCSYEADAYIQQPSQIIIFAESTPQTNFQLGSIQILAIGGEPPYSYFIDGNLIGIMPLDTVAGDYEISVVDANGCEQALMINIAYIDYSGISNIDSDLIGVYPNPNSTGIFEFYGFKSDEIIGVYDLTGRQIAFEIDNNNLKLNPEFKGVAQLIITKEGAQYTIRIIVL